jgi:putative transposase
MSYYSARAQCKLCGSYNTIKDGKAKGIQKWECKDCGRKFLDNSASPGMKTPREQIERTVRQYYQGTSLNTIRLQLQEKYNNCPAISTIYKWIVKYTQQATNNTRDFHPVVGGTWVIDETALSVAGERLLMWDIIDTQTRFLLASRLLFWQNPHEVYKLFEQATKKALKIPRVIVTDKLANYLEEMNGPFRVENTTEEIAQFHNLFQSRNNMMSDLKQIEKAIQFANGWLNLYNYYRPQKSLGNKTPAEIAKTSHTQV